MDQSAETDVPPTPPPAMKDEQTLTVQVRFCCLLCICLWHPGVQVHLLGTIGRFGREAWNEI
jgi:hypothetical protein